MDSALAALPGILMGVVTIVVIFTFITVVSWSDNRRKEREAYYRSEILRKAIEQGGESAQTVVAMMQDEERRATRRRIEGLRLGGLITIAVGLGVMILLYALEPHMPVWLAGSIPFLIGLVMAVYAHTQKTAVKCD